MIPLKQIPILNDNIQTAFPMSKKNKEKQSPITAFKAINFR